MTKIFQSPVGAMFVERLDGDRLSLCIQQHRTYASIEVGAKDLDRLIDGLRDAAKEVEPPLLDFGSTSRAPIVCRICAALVAPENVEFHATWHDTRTQN